MKAIDLEQHLCRVLRQGTLDSFWLVCGSDGFLAVESADMIRRAARESGYLDRQVLEMTGRSDWSQLTMSAADVGLFSDKKIVEVRIPGGKPGTEGGKAIISYLDRPVDGVVTIFSIPTPDWAGRKAQWWQTLREKATVVDCDTVERRELPQWLSRRLAKNGQSASPETLEYFADLIEGNLFAAAQEIEKLSLLYPESDISEENIRSSVSNSSRFDFDTLFESIHLGEADRVARIIDGLEAQNEALPYLLAMLTTDIRSLIKLRSGQEKGMRRIPGVFATPSMNRAAKRLTLKKLSSALLVCAWIDRIAKGIPVPNRDDNPWTELKSVALFLAR